MLEEFAVEPIFQENGDWGFWDEVGQPSGYYKRWEDARNILMMYCIDFRGIGDQKLLYADLKKTLKYSWAANHTKE